MKSLIQEFVNQSDLQKSDGSDAGKNDVEGKGAEVQFNLMRNTINSDGKIRGSDVANYLEKAADLNDEVETVLYGLETDDGQVVKVYVNAQQADQFEAELKKMLGMQDDIEEAIELLSGKFDIVDVVWPKGSREEREHGHETGQEDDFNIDDNANLDTDEAPTEEEPTTDADLEDMEVIATVPDEEEVEAATELEPKKKKKKKEEGEEGSSEEEREEEAEGEEGSSEEEREEEEGSEKKEKKGKKKEKHSLLKSIGAGLGGKKEEPKMEEGLQQEGEVIQGKFGKQNTAQPAQPLTMMQAFGSPELNALHDAGIKLFEKPDYWEDLNAAKYTIHDIQLKKAQHALATVDMKLKTYSGRELFGTEHPRSPLARLVMHPEERCFIVKVNGGRYLVDTSGASTYIRNWARIASPTNEDTQGDTMSIGSKFLDRVLNEGKEKDIDAFRDNFDIPGFEAGSALMTGVPLPMARQVIQLYHLLGVSVETLSMKPKLVKTAAMEVADELRTNRPLRLAAQRLFSALAEAKGFVRAEKPVQEATAVDAMVSMAKKDPMSREKDVMLIGNRVMKQIEAVLAAMKLPSSVLTRAMRQDRDALMDTAVMLGRGGIRTRFMTLGEQLGLDLNTVGSDVKVEEAIVSEVDAVGTVPTQGTAQPEPMFDQFIEAARELALALGIPERQLDLNMVKQKMKMAAMRDRAVVGAVLPRMQFIINKLTKNDK